MPPSLRGSGGVVSGLQLGAGRLCPWQRPGLWFQRATTPAAVFRQPSAAGRGGRKAGNAAAQGAPEQTQPQRQPLRLEDKRRGRPERPVLRWERARWARGSRRYRARGKAARGTRAAPSAPTRASPQRRTWRRLAGRAPPALPALPGRVGAGGGGLFRLPAEATSLAGRARSQSVSAARPCSPPGRTPPGLRAPGRAVCPFAVPRAVHKAAALAPEGCGRGGSGRRRGRGSPEPEQRSRLCAPAARPARPP